MSHNAPFHTTISMLLHNTFSTNCLNYFFLYSFICIFSFSFFSSVFCMYCFPYSYFIFYLFSPDIFWYLFLQTVPYIDHKPFLWAVFNFFQTMSISFFLAFLFVSFMIPLLFSYSLWHMICHHYNNFCIIGVHFRHCNWLFISINNLVFIDESKVNSTIMSFNIINCKIIKAWGFLCHIMTNMTYFWLKFEI